MLIVLSGALESMNRKLVFLGRQTFLLLLAHLSLSAAVFMDCDRMFIHTDGGPTQGEFSSPNYPSSYPSNLQCIYTFIAKPKERVQVSFEEFHLAGHYPNCADYVDMYSEMQSPNDDLIMQPLGGRYCGTIGPQKRISLHHVIVLVFHTRNNSEAKGFLGKYEFVSSDRYVVGTPAPPGTCGFAIHSKHMPTRQKTGNIYSPTYPGKYPANRKCYYRLLGEKGQRVHIDLLDFDLYFGGLHCPYDFITVHDGDSAKAPIIQKICGLQQKLEIFSQTENLYIEFETNNPPFAEHRGFNIQYTFSKDFVDVYKMMGGQSNIDHMRGTECDFRIRSGKETTHTITSPSFPQQYPLNRTCTYFLDGMQGPQHLEKVLLSFESFAIASRLADATRLEDLIKCGDSFLAVFTLETNGYPGKSMEPDHKFCSTELPPSLQSDGPRMVLVLQTGPYSAPSFWNQKGFRATVTFQTDFGIPGRPIKGSNVCQFEFDSRLTKEGEFNSPRFPANYPTNTECIYYLNGLPGEQVVVSFSQMNLNGGLSEADECGDYVEVVAVYPHGIPMVWSPVLSSSLNFPPTSLAPLTAAVHNRSTEVKLGRYCKQNTPGPISSGYGSNSIRVTFRSDETSVSTGFKAKYRFVREVPPLSPELTLQGCGGLIQGKSGGLISFPVQGGRYREGLDCNWLIRSRPGYRVLLVVVKQALEGTIEFKDQMHTVIRSDCAPAVIRIYTNQSLVPKAEFCGTKITPTLSEFLSDANQLRVNFITRSDADGNEGFNLSWTEVTKSETCEEGLFRCNYNGYCIDSSLCCNGLPNCGEEDSSDEAQCEQPKSKPDRTVLLLIGIAGGLALVLLTIVCIFIRRRRNKRKRHKMLHQLEPRPFLPEENGLYFHHSFA